MNSHPNINLRQTHKKIEQKTKIKSILSLIKKLMKLIDANFPKFSSTQNYNPINLCLCNPILNFKSVLIQKEVKSYNISQISKFFIITNKIRGSQMLFI